MSLIAPELSDYRIIGLNIKILVDIYVISINIKIITDVTGEFVDGDGKKDKDRIL